MKKKKRNKLKKYEKLIIQLFWNYLQQNNKGPITGELRELMDKALLASGTPHPTVKGMK